MKAKDVINLCEDYELTADECYELVSSYFIKRMKSIDATVEKIPKSFTVVAKFIFRFNNFINMKQSNPSVIRGGE